MRRFMHRIASKDTPPASGEYLPTFNPLTEEPWAEIARGNETDVDMAVEAASDALKEWRRAPPFVRANCLWRLNDAIADHAEELARMESLDIGKVIREMRGQMLALPRWYQYWAGQCHNLHGDVIPLERNSVFNYTLREPYGVVGIIPSFNSPILLTTFSLAPALAAGNAVVVKPSELASTAVLEFAALFDEAGFPPGLVNVITGYGHEVGDALVGHPGVAKVVFTGGVETAKLVGARAAQSVKPLVLELGGKSANIVLPDADLPAAVSGILAGIFAAAGQTCVAGSRLLVHEALADQLVDLLTARAQTIILGDPLDEETEMGPLAQAEIRDRVDVRVRTAVQAGAIPAVGGDLAVLENESGWFYPPTILNGVTNDMEVAREELFGPVLSVIRISDEDEAVSVANDSPFGLAAGLWTRNLGVAHRMAENLEASTIWINTYRSLSYASPFGGRKSSGYGRENGREGLLEFTQTKSVWIETSEEPISDPFVLR